MGKFKTGETSAEVKKLSDDITASIKEKTRLIKEAIELEHLPEYIPLNKKQTRINVGDVHSWESEELGIIKYVYNTANTDKNSEHLTKLKNAVIDFNQFLAKKKLEPPTTEQKSKSSYKTRNDLLIEVNELQAQIAILDREVVEIFRAFNQLRSFITTNNYDNKRYHEILRALVLSGNQRLKAVK
ncbi:hypothetical protein MTF68_13865 [Pseudoalteromonas sp. 2CM37A]|uniref:hypothetical protein n=1 Tax=Pseudoalteromonas sp. 2CM37A TaxID=2929853 RepID=UPI0020C05D51|nr:hypothetical protein [Pseudoalteromonas sp. 2CM37A]MCK8118645.1 hypothetical protein [Pseudoalteromonas sp. 2CM37A]